MESVLPPTAGKDLGNKDSTMEEEKSTKENLTVLVDKLSKASNQTVAETLDRILATRGDIDNPATPSLNKHIRQLIKQETRKMVFGSGRKLFFSEDCDKPSSKNRSRHSVRRSSIRDSKTGYCCYKLCVEDHGLAHALVNVFCLVFGFVLGIFIIW